MYDEDLRRMWVKSLERAGYEVIPFKTVAEGTRVLAATHFDLVIIDDDATHGAGRLWAEQLAAPESDRQVVFIAESEAASEHIPSIDRTTLPAGIVASVKRILDESR